MFFKLINRISRLRFRRFLDDNMLQFLITLIDDFTLFRHLASCDMVHTAENGINMLQRDALRLGDEEVGEDGKHDVTTHEKVEGVIVGRSQEAGERLAKDDIGELLTLR